MGFTHSMSKGDKVILVTKFNSSNGIHVSTVVEVGKTTAKLDCGNTVCLSNYEYHEQHKEIVRFFKRWACDRKKVTCEIRGTQFQEYPVNAYVFSQKKYDELKKMVLDQVEKENAESTRISKKEDVMKDFNAFEREEEAKLFIKIRDKFVNTVCKNCKHYMEDGTCSNDNHFYRVGVLSEANYKFYSVASTMCHWDIKDNN